MNKTQLVREAAKRAGVTQKVTRQVLAAVTDTVQGALHRGDKVLLIRFGTWTVARRQERTGRHPRTGEPLTVPAHKVPVFRPGKSLKETV
ncbi:MAG TPA: HU family DNA-binding protein [Symbiobacteriaceae bacterium]|jgi:DNA-binding protein HU-beta|nr:HU family DNA-binding protein [Symbiobacteriaceae bacterium]